jgi:hypothetical protein
VRACSHGDLTRAPPLRVATAGASLPAMTRAKENLGRGWALRSRRRDALGGRVEAGQARGAAARAGSLWRDRHAIAHPSRSETRRSGPLRAADGPRRLLQAGRRRRDARTAAG